MTKRPGLALGMCVLAAAIAPSPTAFGQAQPAAPEPAPTPILPEISVVGSTPLLGAGVNRDQVPAATNVLTPAQINRTGVPSLTGALSTNVPSVNLNDASGNPFQPNLLFRGFTASPVEGTEQGLAVYVNGARFNSPFGDTVNWDLIPPNAIDTVNIEGPNPVFGLNALGGSVSVKLKNGFTYHGGEITAYGGSNGRAAGLFEYGIESGNTAAYIAADVTRDDGWRNTSASTLYRLYTDLGWRTDRSEVHLGITAASTSLGNPGATPTDLLSVARTANSTAPNVVDNKYLGLNLNGNYDISDKTSLQYVLYYSNLSQRLTNGVTVDAQACADGSGNLCNGSGDNLTDRSGNPIPDFLNGGPYGGTGQQGTDTNAFGASAQVSDFHDVFGLPNHVVGGVSFDGGDVTFDGNQTIGGLSQGRVVYPPEIIIDQANGSIAPVRLNTTNRYYGIFFTDTLNVTPRLSLSASGRFNIADIELMDQNGTALNGSHSYNHFNPGIGATYKVLPNLAVFASFAESNRAPTPVELSCADPALPCSLPNFFISDPNLKQPIADTYEVGMRGRLANVGGARATWNVDLFRTDLRDDIIYVPSQITGLSYFENAGRTRRQGVEVNVALTRGPLHATLGYAYVDATYQSPLTLNSPNNPQADANGQIQVKSGNRIPGVPPHRFNFTVDYSITPRWTVGASGILADSQFLFADEANQNKKLGGYFVTNLNTSYRITDHIQAFALVDNVFDQKYSTFGTYSQVIGLPAPEVAGGITSSKVESPAAPISAYGGIRITF